MSKKFNSPKRRIERIRNRVDLLMPSSATQIVLHTAEDAKTLVRTIVDLTMVFIAATAAEADWNIMLLRAEKGIVVLNPATTQGLDSKAPIALIWENSDALKMLTEVGNVPTRRIQADIKGMRKLKETDTIELNNLASASTTLRLIGTVTMFFKE